MITEATHSRARGCLLGQLVGDSLGSLVEFKTKEQIRAEYPEGVRLLADGGPFNLKAGQPTDDSEMALALARCLVRHKIFSVADVTKAYKRWYNSNPFDCGITIASALTTGSSSAYSESNGSMMRISPLAIWGSGRGLYEVLHWASRDANITHRNKVAIQATALYAELMAYAIRGGGTGEFLYACLCQWIKTIDFEPAVVACIKRAKTEKPSDYHTSMGWVLIAFQNALWQMLHAPNFEEGVVDTVMQGGDTDTNAAIAGALLGAIYGEEAIPTQWKRAVLNCRTSRPREYWPIDALKLADDLLCLSHV